MQFQRQQPDVVRSVRQRWLLTYWERLRKGRSVPSWKELDAEEFARMADSMQFCDVVTEGGEVRFLIRFRGARVIEAYGECDGQYLDDTMSPLLREATLDTYRMTVKSRMPVYTICNTPDRDGKPVDFERLLLPFARDGDAIDRVLMMAEWVSIEGGFKSRDLLKEQAAAPAYSVCATIEQIETAIVIP